MNKAIKTLFFLLFIFCILSYSIFCPDVLSFGIQQNIFYSAVSWLDNEHIIFAKHVDYYKKGFGILADISKGRYVLSKNEIQICSMKIDGTEEKIIKNIIINYRGSSPISSEGNLIGPTYIKDISYNSKRSLISFYAQNWGLYLMNRDGSGMKRILKAIDESGRRILNEEANPRFSPDGTKLLYCSENNLWLYDIDTAGASLLLENAKGGLWHPSGEKVYFYRSPDIYGYDLKTKKENKLFSTWHYLDDIYPDGTKILTGSLYDLHEGKTVIIKGLQHGLNYPRFSPDGKRIVGDPVNAEGSICIVDIDGANFKVLR